jgi:hypothetical protein
MYIKERRESIGWLYFTINGLSLQIAASGGRGTKSVAQGVMPRNEPSL